MKKLRADKTIISAVLALIAALLVHYGVADSATKDLSGMADIPVTAVNLPSNVTGE